MLIGRMSARTREDNRTMEIAIILEEAMADLLEIVTGLREAITKTAKVRAPREAVLTSERREERTAETIREEGMTVTSRDLLTTCHDPWVREADQQEAMVAPAIWIKELKEEAEWTDVVLEAVAVGPS